MHRLGIAQLNPELPALESTQFKAAVTLIWPYSSSARQFALLLAEPDFRLRRKKGQVRARFSGSSAKAIATTGVGIGDEVILSLRGAQFVKEGAVSTPGKSIDWELSYSQTVAVRIFRDGNEIANLELVDVAPTPAPRSPERSSPASAQNWSSPAFLKRLRLSDGPLFETPYDPLADENADGHDKKRRRKSYRDWKAWTYSARTPSPEKGSIDVEEDLDMAEASPSRGPQLPRTPVSPAKLGVATGQLDQVSGGEKTLEKSPGQGKHVRDTTYDELYAGPDEIPPADVPYAFGGDTEVETEVNTEEEDAVEIEPDVVSVVTTEANTEGQEDEVRIIVNDSLDIGATANEQNFLGGDTESATEADSEPESGEAQQAGAVVVEVWEAGDDSHATSLIGAPTITMPPPTLHTLQTDFPAAAVPGMLTPIGREPPSPTLEPMDSATLPLPSPFPGEHDADEMSSYLDHISAQQPSVEPEDAIAAEELPSDASYIGETSFFSSINSSKASALHPNHESAFTPVRFTFGMDGAGVSRPLALSSPAQQESQLDIDEEADHHIESAGKRRPAASVSLEPEASSVPAPEALYDTLAARQLEDSFNIQPEDHSETHTQPDVVELSSGSEAEEPEESEAEASDEEVVNDESLVIVSDLDQGEFEREIASAMDKEHFATDGSANLQDLHQVQEDVDSTSPIAPEPTTLDEDMPFPDYGDEGASLVESHTQSNEVGEFRVDQDEFAISRTSVTHQSQDITSTDETSSQQAEAETFSEFIDVDFVPEPSNVVSTLKEPMHTLTPPQQEKDSDIEPLDEGQVLMKDQPDHHPLPLTETDVHMEDASSPLDHLDVEDHHPDIKMESIEEPLPFQTSQPHAEVVEDSPSELLIWVPDEGDTLGEMHTIAEPHTAPARNTRSITKATASPAPEETVGPRRTTRSTRSKASVTSAARTTLSPPVQTRSTTSPSHDGTQTSPYNLRSQQEVLSPARDTAVPAPSPRRSSRKHASQRSVDSVPDVGSSRSEARDMLNSDLIPSQAVGQDDQGHESMQLRSPPAPKTRAGAEVESNNTNAQVTSPTKSSSPPSAVTVSDLNIRRTRHHAYDTSGEHQGPVEELLDVDALVGETEGESSQIQSSLPLAPSTSENHEFTHHSTPSTTFASTSVNQQSFKDNNRLITPEATQQSTTNSPIANHLAHQQQSLPMTPQLTQATTAGLRLSQADVDTERHAEDVTKSSPITKSTPRRNVTTTDVASPSASPQSPRASPSAEGTGAEQPSIGLSTPLAYYTPLKDLGFFLNRSSHFHSSENPDILALVTTPTSTSERAAKGPKHWNTTLHITDLGSWPGTTTVNIFRAYQSALPHADAGDVILLRAFAVKSLNRHPMLISADESSWCVWRYGKPAWGHKKSAFGELEAREEMKGPSVERGEGEWREVERLRAWFVSKVKGELEKEEESRVKTRSRDKVSEEKESQVKTRSKDKDKALEGEQVEQKKESERGGVRTRSQDKKAANGEAGP